MNILEDQTVMCPIYFTAYGEAKPGGSKTAFAFRRANGSVGANVVDSCKTTKSWQHVVATAAREVYQGELLEGPLYVGMKFFKPRPKGHFNSKGEVKPSAPRYPTTRPDVLKLARAVEDALTGVVWRDDAQIVCETIIKLYGSPARVEVWIRMMEF